MTRRVVAAVLVSGCSLVTFVTADSTQPVSDHPAAIEKAKALFKQYADLEHAFDVAVADLYSDEAVITNKRTYPSGQVREMTLPAPQYKALIRQAMPLAKQAGDMSTYSDCKYAPEAGRVRINCTRYSERKKYSSPVSLLVGADKDGKWLIFEELSESQP